MQRFGPGRRGLTVSGVVCLLAVLAAQLVLSIRGESQTWDEGDHIFAGYRSWTRGDFGLNPEHPPLVKLLATLPLLPMDVRLPKLQNRYFKVEAFLDGRDFVFGNDPDRILFRTRMAAAALTLVLALLVFFAAREMFGMRAGFVALILLVFEPNLLAHGALVTTDSGLTGCLFGTVYAFYRYAKAPSAPRLILTGLAAGLTLGAKHTGLVVFPVLLLLAACDGALRKKTKGRDAVRLAASLAVIGVISIGVLWALYGFRYRARPNGLELNPPLAQVVNPLPPPVAGTVSLLARRRLLPESYLYGFADVVDIADTSSSYLFGRVYRHGVWFYFPAAFAIKSTVGFLAFFLMALAAIATGTLPRRREVLFLTVPAALYLAVAMSSGLNIGARHILPLYAFLSVLAGGAADAFLRRDHRWSFSVAALLLFHAVSSVRSFPTYLAYSNELWGGPSATYKYLTDSNTDWAQQLKGTKKYLDRRGVKDCWFAYFAQTVVEPRRYGIPCKVLPTISSLWLNEVEVVPTAIEGPVLISAASLSGYETGPGAVNPYHAFQQVPPTAVIEHGIFVYDGRFQVPLASAITHAHKASELLAAKQVERALQEARAAVDADPNSVRAQIALGDVLRSLERADEARAAYRKALDRSQTVEPEFQASSIPLLRQRIAGP